MTEREQIIANLLYMKRDCLEGSDTDKTLDSAVEFLNDPDRVRVVRCSDCRFWEPENAEEGDSYGYCQKPWGTCKSQQTDMNWFCADGERDG